MPELPDVEGFRRSAARYAGGRLVDRVEVLDHALVRNATAQRLGRALAGTRLGRPDRHGKWLVLPADGAAVLLHFGMTGLLAWTARDTEFHVHDRVVFHCRGGQHGRVPQAPGWLTGARGEKDARCPRCGSLLRRAAVGGRTAVWCPRCQRA